MEKAEGDEGGGRYEEAFNLDPATSKEFCRETFSRDGARWCTEFVIELNFVGLSGDGSRRVMVGSLSMEDEIGGEDVDSELRRSIRIGDDERCPPNTSAVMESRRKSFSGDGGAVYCDVPYSEVGRALTGVALSFWDV